MAFRITSNSTVCSAAYLNKHQWSKETSIWSWRSMVDIAGPLQRESSGGFPAQRASNAESVSMTKHLRVLSYITLHRRNHISAGIIFYRTILPRRKPNPVCHNFWPGWIGKVHLILLLRLMSGWSRSLIIPQGSVASTNWIIAQRSREPYVPVPWDLVQSRSGEIEALRFYNAVKFGRWLGSTAAEPLAKFHSDMKKKLTISRRRDFARSR